VSLHLDGDGNGGDIVIISGRAAISDDPPADAVPSYVEKYRERMARNGWSPADFAGSYSVPLRITPARLRGW
jgi:PPOX class probable F420-dependent enzyme